MLMLSLLWGQLGCSHHSAALPSRPEPLSESLRARLGTVGLVSARYEPEVTIKVRELAEDFWDDQGAGAGALAGTAAGTAGASALLPYALLFPPVLMVAGGIVVVSGLSGAVLGTVVDPGIPDSASSGEDLESELEMVSRSVDVQDALREHVYQARRGFPVEDVIPLREYGPESPGAEPEHELFEMGGIDSLLVVAVDEVTLYVDDTIDPPLTLEVTVSTVLYHTSDGEAVDRRTFRCRGGKRKYREWKAQETPLFAAGLSRCYERVADRIIEEVFMVYLAHQDVTEFGGRFFARAKADSTRPTLEWEPFLTPEFPGKRPDDGADGIKNVTYDLRLWREDAGFPGKLVYRRDGLAEPFHTVTDPLDPSTQYFWTVRARFEVAGKPRATPWAVSLRRKGYSPDRFDRVTHDFYFRYRTPQQPETAAIPASP